MPDSLPFFRTMVARISPDDIVLYANGSLAAYLGVSKRSLVGSPLETLAARASGEISECFSRPTGAKTGNRLVTDSQGRVFELKAYSEGGVLDIVIDEVTTPESVNRHLENVSGTSVDTLTEEELRTSRQPERRWMTVSHSRLNGIAHLAGHLAPMETRLMVNSFVEEAAEAVLETGCGVHHVAGESVVGLYGAPRYFSDHAVRALRAACNQIEKVAQLRSGFYRQGKEMPPMSCGLWSGETFVGTLGSSTSLHYTAIGEPPEMAAELSRIARPGEVLVCDFTLQSLIKNLPEGWQAICADSETEPDLSDFQWSGAEVTTLPPELERKVWLIGPGVDEDTSRVEFYLDYLWALKLPGHDDAIPVLRAVRPALIGDSLELSADNVVTTQFAQTLGKYKLLCVIGTGGMGKVWKAQDRYGNIVAIKVLHSSETASESQLKRFQREAEIMARLPHRNICRVFEMSDFEGIQFLVMEYVDGLTLADLLYERTRAESHGANSASPDIKSLIQTLRSEKSAQSQNPEPAPEESTPRSKTTRILPVEQTLSLFLKVCDAVQFAHEHGVLHRDLKPGNILLREEGEPLVADFGLAKLDKEASGHSLSVTGNVVGTLENMAPEQAESSKSVDERADVYSLGTILYQMLTGRRHFEATGNIVVDAQALQNHEPPRPRTLNSRLDSDLDIILLKALRNSPAERYRTVAALKSDIEHYRKGEVISARPVSAVELIRKLILRNRAVSAVIIASLLVIISGSVAAFWKISERADAAEKARVLAEDALLQTETQRELARNALTEAKQQAREAQIQSAEAERRRKEATEALAKLAEAQTSEAEARLRAEGAAQETKGEREAREAAEQKYATLSEQQAAEKQAREERMRDRPRFSPRPENQEVEAARQAFMAGFNALNGELSPFELMRLDKNPDEVIRRLSNAIEFASAAVLADPTFTPAWILKGRLHLAALETVQSRQSFQSAAEAAEKRRLEDRPDLVGQEDIAALLALTAKLPTTSSDRFSKAAEIIREEGAPQDRVIGEIQAFFGDKPGIVKSTLGNNPLDRKVSAPEASLALIGANGGVGKVSLNGGDLTISDIPNLSDLGTVKNFSVNRVKISGASQVDWKTLAALPLLASLDLASCEIEQFPLNTRGFTRLRSLSLASTLIGDLSFARWLPMLDSLDISDTSVTDLSTLSGSRRLRSLDCAGLALSNIRTLLSLPLERLTISPLLITDKVGLSQLRGHGTLKILRTTDDPEEFPALEFWRKLDSGGYAVAH